MLVTTYKQLKIIYHGITEKVFRMLMWLLLRSILKLPNCKDQLQYPTSVNIILRFFSDHMVMWRYFGIGKGKKWKYTDATFHPSVEVYHATLLLKIIMPLTNLISLHLHHPRSRVSIGK